MPRGRPFHKQQREVVDITFILANYPVNRRWTERHRDALKPFKVPGSRKNFYFKDEVEAVFSRQEVAS
jgi:hypothetical protein